MTNAEAWFSIALRPRKPEGSLGRTAQDGHLDSHTAPELWSCFVSLSRLLQFKRIHFPGALPLAVKDVSRFAEAACKYSSLFWETVSN